MTKNPSGNEWCLDLPGRTTNARGTLRSLNGAAGESLVIGRAIAAGFILFFKAWRDAKYDAVLDHEGRLYRVEIKYSGDGTRLGVTSGGRSGKQIDKKAPSREKVLSVKNCDVLIGVHLGTGRCWVVPVEIIEIFGKKSLSTSRLGAFEEAWWIFTNVEKHLAKYKAVTRLQSLTVPELKKIWAALTSNGQKPPKTLEIPRGDPITLTKKWQFIVGIWLKLAEKP